MTQTKTPPTERIKKVIDELHHQTDCDAYRLKIDPEKKTTIFCSKIGGLPYWDLSKPYPTDTKGENLLLLAQINFDEAEIDADSPLPQTGLLQFFVADDDIAGADFDCPHEQTNFRVVYHAQVDETTTEEQIREKGIPDMPAEDSYGFPVMEEAALQIKKQNCAMTISHYAFDSVIANIIQEVCGESVEPEGWYSFFTKAEREYFFSHYETDGHWMLGYPFFTQQDPRWGCADLQKYDTLLFQLDSDGIGKKDYVLWGDCGVGNFFIPLENLKKKDFSHVLYSWDCC